MQDFPNLESKNEIIKPVQTSKSTLKQADKKNIKSYYLLKTSLRQAFK